MPTYQGAYSPDPDFSTKYDDLAYMPGAKPMTTARDPQKQFPGKNQIIPDRGGWADDFSRGFPSQAPFRGKNHPKY